MTNENTPITNTVRVLGTSESRGTPAPSIPPSELVSIVLPCLGQLEFTRLCVPSLLQYKGFCWELVFVDVDSLDGTAEYIEGLKAASAVRIDSIHVRVGQGLGAACDEGIARSQGRYVVLLSNDTVVPYRWLDQLVALAAHDSQIGAVGAMSNHASGLQSLGEVPYRFAPATDLHLQPESRVDPRPFLASVNEFAEKWRIEHRGQWFEATSLDPFCVLFKREALDAIGPFERLTQHSGPGSKLCLFDPIDVGLRLGRSGFRLACCKDLFVHHFGSRMPLISTA